MSVLKNALCCIGLLSGLELAFAGAYPEAPIKPPKNWGDFQMGLNNNDRVEWNVPMKAALDAGVKFERRYLYITTKSDADNVYFSDWKNYATDSYYKGKNVKPAIVLYFVNDGIDNVDQLVTNCANSAHMKDYLETISRIALKAKGTQPIYVIEPDLWGYMLQKQDEAKINYLPKSCNLGNLGLPWLAGHGNTIGDLPEAIFKTIRAQDPEAYAGILMAYWGYQGGSIGSQMVDFSQSDVLRVADSSGVFLNRLLEGPDKGDFIGFEKNGQNAGWYKAEQGKLTYMWNNTQNAKWLDWSQRVSQRIKLPALGWQICLGQNGLPNTTGAYEDTFFEYFFGNSQKFVDAGFVGMLAGCASQGLGTFPSLNATSGDKGYFYGELAKFNAKRPYLAATPTLAPRMQNLVNQLNQVSDRWILTGASGHVQLLNLSGQVVGEWDHQNQTEIPLGLVPHGQYILKIQSKAVQSWNVHL